MIDFDLIPFDQIKPNSLLVLRYPGTRDEVNTESLEALMHALRDRIPNDVKVLVMDADTELCHVPEHVMAAAGWVRKT